MTPPKTDDWHKYVTQYLFLPKWCVVKRFKHHSRHIRASVYAYWLAEAELGLVKAARSYDPDYRHPDNGRPVQFNTYATWVIFNHFSTAHRQEGLRRQRINVEVFLSNLSEGDSQLEEFTQEHKDFADADNAELIDFLIARAGLTDRERYVITGVYWKDQGQRQIGDELGLSPTTISKEQRTAIRKLQQAAESIRTPTTGDCP